MLRLTRELVNRGFDSRQELLDLLMQINLMEAYTTLQGKQIDKNLAQSIAKLADVMKRPPDRKGGEELKAMDDASVMEAIELAFEVHGSLSALIKPATPESLEASAPRKGWARVLWPRVTDILIATTFLAVAACAIGFGLKTQTTNANIQTAFQQLAYLGAALLGASFSGLFTAYKFVQNRTFDPASGSSYMVRVVLGTVSGLILANIGNLVLGSANGDQTSVAAAGQAAASNPKSILTAIGPGTLALVGGYSADAVNMILQRIADTLVTTVRGNADDAIKATQAQLQAESKTAAFEQRQATVVALSEMLKSATDDTTKNNIQTLMAAVGQGNVAADILKPVKSNGDGLLDMTGGPVKPVDPTAIKSETVKADDVPVNGANTTKVPADVVKTDAAPDVESLQAAAAGASAAQPSLASPANAVDDVSEEVKVP